MGWTLSSPHYLKAESKKTKSVQMPKAVVKGEKKLFKKRQSGPG